MFLSLICIFFFVECLTGLIHFLPDPDDFLDEMTICVSAFLLDFFLLRGRSSRGNSSSNRQNLFSPSLSLPLSTLRNSGGKVSAAASSFSLSVFCLMFVCSFGFCLCEIDMTAVVSSCVFFVEIRCSSFGVELLLLLVNEKLTLLARLVGL